MEKSSRPWKKLQGLRKRSLQIWKYVSYLPNTANTPKIITSLNNELQKMARETGCGFVTTKDTFTLANGEPNDGYLMDDGIHLNERGATKLVENWKSH